MSDNLTVEEQRHRGRDWKDDITGGALEEEGIFGFSFGLVAASTNFTVEVASCVTSAALGMISGATYNAGRLLTGSPNSDEIVITKTSSQEQQRRDDETSVVIKIVTYVPQMILNTIFPMTKTPTSSRRLLTHQPNIEIPLLESATTDLSFYTAKSSESVDRDMFWDDADDADLHFQKSSESASAADSSVRTDRTSSLSLSDGGAIEDDSDNGYDEFFTSHEDAEELQIQRHSQSYYLDISALLSKGEVNEVLPLTKGKKDEEFFVFQNHPLDKESLQSLLDFLVKNALNLARDDSENNDNKCLTWKPEGDTKKTLQRMHNCEFEERTNLLANTVLKWTGTLKNEKGELRMIKTRGIINMSPLDLKDLLIDCSRGHLVNKNSLGKKDVDKFQCNIGTTTIVENTMKVPFVGGEITSMSLTHSRFVENDPTIGENFYIIFSKSVQKELDMPIGIPFYSVSVLRPVGDDAQKTDLVNVAQISDVPVPKFLVNKIAFTGAVDFFTNLRSL